MLTGLIRCVIQSVGYASPILIHFRIVRNNYMENQSISVLSSLATTRFDYAGEIK